MSGHFGDAVVETPSNVHPTSSALPTGDMEFDDLFEGEDGDAGPGQYNCTGEERADSDPPMK